MTEIREPVTEKEFNDYYTLRWKILRKPWNQPQGSEQDEQENNSFHLMAVEGSAVIGCCRLQLNSKTEGQIRYMAVDDTRQGKGIGKQLIKEMEKVAINKGCKKIILEARENAVEFYKQNGYKIEKESYLLFNEIQHYTMVKDLTLSGD